MIAVKGEGPFAETVRKALGYAQSRGVDLSGVEVEVAADPSIKDFGAYTEHLGGLRFRIRYNPRYASNSLLAAHEAGHVAYWVWAVKTGRTHFFSNPDVIEPLAEAFGAVTARKLFGIPVTFKDAPTNLTQVLPQRSTYVTVTVGGKPTAVKVPEWDDYMSRYRAGILLSPYFHNMTNWAHIFGNFTAMPGDVIETVHKAWRDRAVEVVPDWGAVWRKEPTWSWPDDSADKSTSTQTQQKPSGTPPINVPRTTTAPQSGDTAQKSNVATNNATQQQTDAEKAVIQAQPSADVLLPPSNVQPPRYFSSDITPRYIEIPAEWGNYIGNRRVLVVFRNWPYLNTTTLKETRMDAVIGAGAVSEGRLRFDRRIPVPRVADPNALIELVDEKTGKVLARLKSDELYKLTSEGAPVTLYWAHVAVEEKWPGWERFVERARELDEKLGTRRQSDTAIVTNPDGTVSTVARVVNAPTEYMPPKVPEDVRRQFEELVSELKKLRDNVNLKNVDEVHNKFIQLRDKALDIARVYPQLIDEANSAVGEVGLKVRETYDKLYGALAKAAGRDSFWRGDGNVKSPIGLYKYDPTTGAFLLTLYDGPTAENVVGHIKEDGTPVVVKKTQNMSEAEEEYSRLLQKPQTAGGFIPPPVPVVQKQPHPSYPLDILTKTPVIGPVLQTAKLLPQMPGYDVLTKMPVLGPLLQTTDLLLRSDSSKAGEGSSSEPAPSARTQPTPTRPTAQANNRQRDFLWPVYSAVDFLTNALKTGAGIKLTAFGVTALGVAKPSPAGEQRFAETTPMIESESEAVHNKRRGGDFMQSPFSRQQQKADESVSINVRVSDYVLAENKERRSLMRPSDYVLIETKARSSQISASDSGFAQSSAGSQQKASEFVLMRSPDYVLIEKSKPSESSISASPQPAGGSGFVHAPNTQQRAAGVRPPDYVLAGQESQRSEEARNSAQTSSGYRPADYIASQQSDSSGRVAQPPSIQLAEVPQGGAEAKRYRGKPVAVPI